MFKKKDDFQFKTLKDEEENFKRIKNITIIFIILVTTILIIYTRFMQDDLSVSKTQEGQAISQNQLDEQHKNEAKAKEKEEQKQKAKKEEQEKKKKEQEEKKRQEKLPKLTDVGKENMAHIYRSDDKKRVFLTFDDGPSEITPQILDTLKENGVKATFFMLGSHVKQFPDIVKRAYKEGHYLANHGYSHDYDSIYASKEEVLKEFNMCNDAVKEVLNEPEYNSHLFRFPGGLAGGKYAEVKQEAKQLLEENDILNVDWNALTGDAETQHPEYEKLMENLKSTTGEKSSVVILMHDAQAKKVTADMLGDVISYLKEQGYEFCTFYDIIK